MKSILVCRETDPRETRVALIPDDIKKLIGMGFSFKVVRGAGIKSGFSDEAYEKAGASLIDKEEQGYDSEIILRILKPQSADGLKKDTLHLSYLDPFNEKALLKEFAEKGIQAVSLEMIPRTTLAQKMDVQSSQTSLAGYVAVVNAAARLPKILPMSRGAFLPKTFAVVMTIFERSQTFACASCCFLICSGVSSFA